MLYDREKPPGPREETPWALAISMVMVMESSPAPALVEQGGIAKKGKTPRRPHSPKMKLGIWEVLALALKEAASLAGAHASCCQ